MEFFQVAFLIASIYVKETLEECDVEYYYQVTIYGNYCTHRRYNCSGITNEKLTEFHKNHWEEPCNANNYCYTVDIINSQMHHLDDTALLTNKTCTPSQLYGLVLTNNQIQTLNENIFSVYSTWNIYEIRELKLDKNDLMSVEAFTFMYLRKLQILDLSFNQLISIGNASYNMPSLEQLFINNNNISYLNNVFEKLVNLQILNISHNRIKHLEEGIFQNLINLKEIDLEANFLQNLSPNTFRNLTLTKLNLSNNRIAFIDQSTFFGLRQLQHLLLSENQIHKIVLGTFQDLSALEELRLDGNYISELQIGLFSNLGELNYLNLSNNRLNVLNDGVLFPLHNLTLLDLDNNNLSYIDYSALLSHFPNLKHVRINKNSWTCSSLIEMLKAFRAKGVDYAVNSAKRYTKQNVYGLPCEKGVQETDNNFNMRESLTNLSIIIASIEEKIDLVPYNISKQSQSYELLNNVKNISFIMVKVLKNIQTLSNNVIEIYKSIEDQSKPKKRNEKDLYTSKIDFYFIIVIIILLCILIVTVFVIVLKWIRCSRKTDIVKGIQMDLIENEV